MFDPNKLYYDKLKYFTYNKGKGNKIEMCDEGGSRSSKTWDNIHLIFTYCDHNRNKKKDIGIFRDTLVNCKDYTLKEFEKCFAKIGYPLIVSNPQKPYVNLFGNNLYFRGLADESKQEASPFDVVYINEVLDIESETMIAGLKMRCKDLLIMDWNPKFTDHWVFNYEKHPNCLFTHSTYKNNKHLPTEIIREIESYDPTNPINIENGTADEYRWKVYGLGLRASPEGIVFNDVTYINSFPDDCEHVSYGMDFGESNETAITKNGLKIIDGGYHLFTQKLFYLPTENSDLIIDVIKRMGIDKHIWCDNNKPGWISDLRNAGIRALATVKFDGSRDYWISTIKRCKVHIVKDPDYRKEQENFKYRVVDGIQLSETIKKHDHLWSSCGYSIVGDFRPLMRN